jgi:poly(hydroxyalkanoate) granule-associated protein
MGLRFGDNSHEQTRGRGREGASMAASGKRRSTRPGARKGGGTAAPAAEPRAALGIPDSVQQVWLAGMGAIARAQQEGPAAFQDAVAEGWKLLDRSRSNAEQRIRDVFESAQDSVQTRIDSARDQASETWDNLEMLFQSRVQRALQQIGVPNAEEIRLLTQRVADLNENVKALAARQARAGASSRGRARPAARQPRKTARKPRAG